MPNSQNPQSPNFVPGVGRLTTDRYDFQAHIDGAGLRHNANEIDLFPTLVIESVQCTTVQQAVAELASFISAPTAPLATSSVPGIIQLSGDLYVPGSLATSPKVGGLQGIPLSSLAPSTGQVLAFNGTYWAPAPGVSFTPSGDLSGSNSSQTVIGIQNNAVPMPSGTNTFLTWSGSSFSWTNAAGFTAGGDLSGTSSSQTVVSLTGAGSHPNETVSVIADALTFNFGTIPYISQIHGTTSGSTVATNMTIKAQGLNNGGVSGAGDIGGTLVLAGGFAHGGDPTQGGVALSVGGDPFNSDNGSITFQVTQVPPPGGLQQVAAFFPSFSTGISSSDIPEAIGGDSFIFIGDIGSPFNAPSGPALTGSLLWSYNGVLTAMQENGVTGPISPGTSAGLPDGYTVGGGATGLLATVTMTPSSTGHVAVTASIGPFNSGSFTSANLEISYNTHGSGYSGATIAGLTIVTTANNVGADGYVASCDAIILTGLTVGTSYDFYLTISPTGGSFTTGSPTAGGGIFVREIT